jgi:hypothetical protein
MDLMAHRRETRNGFERVDAEFAAVRTDLAAHREETRAGFEAIDRRLRRRRDAREKD